MNLETKARFFWMGKKTKTKEAIIEYLKTLEGYPTTMRFINMGGDNQKKHASKYGITPPTLRKTIKDLSRDGLLRYYCKNEDYVTYIEYVVLLGS